MDRRGRPQQLTRSRPSETDALPALGTARAARLRALRQGKDRAEAPLVLEGSRLVADVFASSAPLAYAVVDASRADTHAELVRLLRSAGVDVFAAPPRTFATLVDTVHAQGILAVAPWRESHADEALATETPVVTALWRVADPGNLGTIVRSCDWFGAPAIVRSTGSADYRNRKAVRASMGSLFRVAAATYASLDELAAGCRRAGRALVVATARGGEEPRRDQLPRRTTLLLGSEAHGLPPEAASRAEAAVSVPGAGGAESLNVAIVHAVLLSLLTGQR